MTPRTATTSSLALLLALGAAGCERSPQAKGPVTNPNILPASLFLPVEPEGSRPVHEAKAAAGKGDRLVLRGRIGGAEEPFAAERAIFTIVDPGVKSCADMGEDDHCPTPWDYCCEPTENLVANSATIQIVGPDSRPLKTGLKGVRGLDPLAEVIVVGTVATQDGSGSFVINAERLWVRPSGG